MLEFIDSTNKAIEIHIKGGDYVGDIIYKSGIFVLSACTYLYKCSSSELRQIADKLDELNKV